MSGEKNCNNLKRFDSFTSINILSEMRRSGFFLQKGVQSIETSQKVILSVVVNKINNNYKFTGITLANVSRNNVKIT